MAFWSCSCQREEIDRLKLYLSIEKGVSKEYSERMEKLYVDVRKLRDELAQVRCMNQDLQIARRQELAVVIERYEKILGSRLLKKK